MRPRELVQRLILAELLARPGEGPLARRPLVPRPRLVLPEPVRTREADDEREPR